MKEEYLSFAVLLARKAGKIIKGNFALGMKKEWKELSSPVTMTDKYVEKLVFDAIRKNYPSHGFLGEEGNITEQTEFMWICDPIDGTIPFSHGIPTCVFMLALLRNGRPIVSVIYDPFQERMFTAAQGKGAYLNGKKISVSKHKELKQAVFAVYFWKNVKYNTEKTYLSLIDQDGIDATMGSVGYADMLVACGELSIVVFAGGHPWDSAAGDILVHEAGGKFTDVYGKVIDYRKPVKGHVATNGVLHRKVLQLIQRTNKIE